MPNPDISIEVIADSYSRLGSVWLVGKETGLSGQKVHYRLKRHGLNKSLNVLSPTDAEKIRHYYTHTPKDDFDLNALAEKLSRTKATVCRYAGQMGLTDLHRPVSAKGLETMRRATAGMWKIKPHPRGYEGKKHSPEALDAMRASSSAMWARMKATGTGLMAPEYLQSISDRMVARPTLPTGANAYSRAKRGFRDDLGPIHFRSAWEANVARYLKWLQERGDIDLWEYEPQVFWFEAIKRGVRSYLPDFRITEGSKVYFIEVKGWMDPKSITKLKRMKKYHPSVEIRLLGAKQYRALSDKLGRIIPHWEGKR